jgi:ketosteroid isomerase-like protein
MTQSPRKTIAGALIARAGQGDAASVEPLITDDFVLEQMVRDPEQGTSAAGTTYGRAEYLGFLGAVREMTQSGMNLAVELMVEEGDHVAVFGTSDAASPSGWRYRNAYCWHLVFRGEQVSRMREFYDTALGHRLLQG